MPARVDSVFGDNSLNLEAVFYAGLKLCNVCRWLGISVKCDNLMWGDTLQGTGAVNLVRVRSQDSLTPIMLHKEVKRSVFIF